MSDPIIPETVLARIFHEVAFKDENTRITAKAMKLSQEYIRLFVQEAIMRSNEERLLEGNSLTTVDGIDNVDKPMDDEEDPEKELEDTAIYDGDDTNNFTTQRPPTDTENDTLDSRHLAKIAGVLVLDFWLLDCEYTII